MTQSLDQNRLYLDLTEKLDKLGGQDQLIAYMGQVLLTLLRRQGDGEFRTSVQDAFISGLAGRDWADQIALSREVVLIVIAKRPEIAAAWQKTHAGAAAAAEAHRRAIDRGERNPPTGFDDLPDLDLIDIPKAEAPPPPYAFAQAEAAVAAYVIEALTKRLDLFRPPEQPFPSIAYVHEQPFFLFSPAFAETAADFLRRTLIPMCRDVLERRVYKHLIQSQNRRPDMAVGEKQVDIWAVLHERLAKLAARLNGARGKLALPADKDGAGYQEIEVPVDSPRVFRVLGVGFRLGTRTELIRKQVKVRSAKELDGDEQIALNLMAQFRNRAGQAGLDLPAECDFEFLAAMLKVDYRRLKQTLKELIGLISHKETSRAYVMERIRAVEEGFAVALADSTALLLFQTNPNGPFGFAELFESGAGTSRDNQVLAVKRPFLTTELARRPRELAFQAREAFRRRAGELHAAAALRALFTVWNVLPRNRFQSELNSAATVFRAFPISFAGDAAEAEFSEIGRALCVLLAEEKIEMEAGISAIMSLYRPLAGPQTAMAPGAFIV